MLMELGTRFEQGDASFLGPIWLRALKRALANNYGALADGPKIDFDKLHRSAKTKSGFVGVYANGKGFRAMAKVEGIESYVGTFQTAEEAAWRRFLYYKENKIPYGELEVDIAAWRARGEQGDDMHLAREIIKHSKLVGTFHIYEKDARAMGLLSDEPTQGSNPPAPQQLPMRSATSTTPPVHDVSHLINEEHHDTGLINEEPVPLGFTELPPTFADDYVPGRR